MSIIDHPRKVSGCKKLFPPRGCSGTFCKPLYGYKAEGSWHKPSPNMESEFCELCFFSFALCSCSYSDLPSQPPVFPEGDIITPLDAAGRQAWMLPTDSILPNVRVGPVEPPPRPVLPASDVLMPPMNPWVPEAGTELPPRAVVASPEQVSASNRRRTNAVPGRFVCDLCPQNFTAKHNLKNHVNSHLQKKPHCCTGSSGCGSSFGTRSSLNRHRKKCKAVPGT